MKKSALAYWAGTAIWMVLWAVFCLIVFSGGRGGGTKAQASKTKPT